MKPYDHQTQGEIEGDVVKHPALIAAINGLLAEHDRLFRYCDAFAGRWEYELRKGGVWTRGIERFASGCAGGKPDVELWRRHWTAAEGLSSTQGQPSWRNKSSPTAETTRSKRSRSLKPTRPVSAIDSVKGRYSPVRQLPPTGPSGGRIFFFSTHPACASPKSPIIRRWGL